MEKMKKTFLFNCSWGSVSAAAAANDPSHRGWNKFELLGRAISFAFSLTLSLWVSLLPFFHLCISLSSHAIPFSLIISFTFLTFLYLFALSLPLRFFRFFRFSSFLLYFFSPSLSLSLSLTLSLSVSLSSWTFSCSFSLSGNEAILKRIIVQHGIPF